MSRPCPSAVQSTMVSMPWSFTSRSVSTTERDHAVLAADPAEIRVLLLDLRRDVDDVLVHEGLTERLGVDLAAHGGDLGHRSPPLSV